jgi:hypothetical protein
MKHVVIFFMKFMFMKFLQKKLVVRHPPGIISDHKYEMEVVKGTTDPTTSYALIRKEERQKGTNEWRLAEGMVSVSRIILLQSSRPW